MKVGEICAGYGGIVLGLRLAGVDVDLRWLAENDPVLDPLHGTTPNLGDITRVDWSAVEPVDLLTAGFPCQPVSAAGRQLGEADARWLWPAVLEAVTTLRPRQVLIENVRNLISTRKGALWAGIVGDLLAVGYDVRWLTLGACHVGAAHHRHRVFALATLGAGNVIERVPMSFCGAKGGTVLPTPAAVSYGSNQGGATGRVGPVRHSLDSLARLDLLPTPQSRDGQGRGTPSVATAEARIASGRRNIDDALALLPTPQARDGDGRGEGDEAYWARRGQERNGGAERHTVRALLPTPTVGDSRNSRNATANRQPSASHHHSGTTLSDVAHAASGAIDPTPRATDGVNGGPSQRGRRGDLAMPSAVQPANWGRYAEAVARHESLYGPAPAPTEPNKHGAPRLAPAFAEWLMCLPAGHVTAKLPRVAALRAIGNGVCPPQLAAAWALLTATPTTVVDMSLGRPVASGAMTTTTEIKEIQDRARDQRQRVIYQASIPLAAGCETPEVVKAALMELAACWREEAVIWEKGTKRGRAGTAKALREAASRVAGFAVNLTKDVADVPVETPSHVELSDEAKDIAAKLAAPIVDPLMDYLTGAAPTYEPVRTEQVFDTLKTEMPDVTADLPSAMARIDNPFTSPQAPTRRAPVAAIPFGALPGLISHMNTSAPRGHVSHSYVSSYEGCSLSAVLSDASRAKAIGAQRPGWSLIGGNAFHNAVERIERAILAGADMLIDVETAWLAEFDAQIKATLDDLVGTPYADASTWHVANGGREGMDWWRVEGAAMLARYVKHHDATWRATHKILQINGTPVIEYPYEMTVRTLDGTTGVTAKGFIDQAWLNVDTGMVTVTDMKSGRSEPASVFQLAEYAHALAMELNPPAGAAPIIGRFWLARKGIYTDAVDVLTRHPLEELQFRYGQAMRGTQAGVFVPNRTNLCVSCGSRDYCPVGSR